MHFTFTGTETQMKRLLWGIFSRNRITWRAQWTL